MAEAREKVHAGIREKLGVEVLAEYEYWEDSKNERESVRKFNRSLGEAGLDEATNDELVGMLYDARADFPELEHLSQPENYDPREMDAERREDLLGQVEELHGVYLKDAGQLLNQEQLIQLEASLGKQRQELDGFMKFTHGMFNRSQEFQQQRRPRGRAVGLQASAREERLRKQLLIPLMQQVHLLELARFLLISQRTVWQ